MASALSLTGTYVGQKKVRAGRDDDLSPTERKELERSRTISQLVLNSDQSFRLEITTGKWEFQGGRVICTPTTFGGQSEEDMRRRAEEMGRLFALSFLFRPFELRVDEGVLTTVDDEALIYTEYRLSGG